MFKLKFPMPQIILGMGLQRWAEELRKWADSWTDKGSGSGGDGEDGADGMLTWNWAEYTLTDGQTLTLVEDELTGNVNITCPASVTTDTTVKLPNPVGGYIVDIFFDVPSGISVGKYMQIVDDAGTRIASIAGSGVNAELWHCYVCYYGAAYVWKAVKTHSW
jgi:hypothetical protein